MKKCRSLLLSLGLLFLLEACGTVPIETSPAPQVAADMAPLDGDSLADAAGDFQTQFFRFLKPKTPAPAPLRVNAFSAGTQGFNNNVHSVFYSQPEELKPNEHFPANITIMKSMNNVDVIRHNNRFYMGFRTAPSHFASEKALMHLLSSADGKRWQLEQTYQYNRDVREPRFVSFNGKLFFYFFTLGTNALAFEPDTMYASERTASGWTHPTPFYEQGFVPWRVRTQGHKTYMSVYWGRGLYGGQSRSEIRLLESEDGLNWEPVSTQPQVSNMPGCEEPEFEFDKEGNIWGTIRLENNGGMIFYAPKDNLTQWKLIKLKDKYDSALILKHEDEFYLLARRNVGGSMDKAPNWLPASMRKWLNLARYSLTTKRTAMYHFDRQNLQIKPMFDFPSHGDTAFPAVAPINANQYLFLNYSSELGIGKDYRWLVGQLKTTRLYSHVLTFERPQP